MELLADVPLSGLSTRRIARRLGLSQPALFRHFRSRDALLEAVIDHAREQLGGVAAAAAAPAHADPHARFDALARGLLGFVEAHPGLPRLLFAHSAALDHGAIRAALEHLVSMQRTLVAVLVREGAAGGWLRPDVDPRDAALLFVGGLQGAILQWELAGRPPGLALRGAALVSLWLGGVALAGAAPGPAPEPADPGLTRGAQGLVDLDVRPVLAGGRDPLEDVLAALERMVPGDLLHLTSPFRPAPLLALLERQGHHVASREAGPGVWSTTVGVGGQPAPLDLLDREPPEPLEAVLGASAELAPGACFAAWVPRYPRLLVGHLEARPLRWQVLEAADGAALIYLRGEGPASGLDGVGR